MGCVPQRELAWWSTVLAVAVTGIELYLYAGQRPRHAAALAGLIFIAAANVLTTVLARQAAKEHEPRSTMRLAWTLIATGALVNAFRSAFEFVYQTMGLTDSSQHVALGLRQIPIAGSLLLTTAGLCAMWSSFTSLGLGLELRRRDWLVIGLLVVLIPPVVWSRAALSDAHSPLGFVRYLQFASPFLLLAAASMSVVLYRISREMGEGLMAVTLRCLAGSFAIRLFGLVLLTVAPITGGAAAALQQMLQVGAHCVFLIGLLYRRELSRATADLLDRYRILGGRQESLRL